MNINTIYYIAEDIRSTVQTWTVTTAPTLTAAKRAAARAQMFQGTDIYVGQEINGMIERIAVKRHPNALNMSARGTWNDL